ncbi:SPOR domain-containing protein [Longibacter salinarum]|uniref:SPOR domain-containing protein n=1 Tax=Longibacter salinarum TaxID=1850348 RepID=A0A2A8CZI7_9BACT|nr:SPOR domain-containing protein [Longibacter salinarum]PEN14105.1 SPOR domain-containing protein [Longibacter salinarum]
MLSRLSLFTLALALILTACSGPPKTADSGDDSSDRGPRPVDRRDREERRATLASVETFDVSQYPTPAAARELDLRHQVPTQLMQGRADEGVTQTIEGFRVQVYSAQDKQAAEEFRERVRQWWAEVQDDAPDDVFRGRLPILVEYGQPYYRVRVGAFADREEAAEALEFVKQEFTDAFVARSTVTVTR